MGFVCFSATGVESLFPVSRKALHATGAKEAAAIVEQAIAKLDDLNEVFLRYPDNLTATFLSLCI